MLIIIHFCRDNLGHFTTKGVSGLLFLNPYSPVIMSRVGLLSIANLKQTCVSSNTGRFVSGIQTGLNLPFLTPFIIRMKATCDKSPNMIRSFPVNFFNQYDLNNVFGVVVGLKIFKDKTSKVLALEFNSRTGSIDRIVTLGSAYSILELVKTQQEYKILSLDQNVPDYFLCTAAKLLTEDSMGVMNGLRDPVQVAVVKIDCMDVKIIEMQKIIDKLQSTSRSSNIDSSKLQLVINPILESIRSVETSIELLKGRINILESTLSAVLPKGNFFLNLYNYN